MPRVRSRPAPKAVAKPKPPKGASRNPIRKDVLNRLRQAILQGTINQGERLVETDIATMLNVSRTPVREAFRELEIEGLVKYEPGRGITVSRLLDDISDIYALRGVLEGLAARLAALRRTEDELKGLRAVVDQMAEAYRALDYRNSVRLHSQFNLLVYQCARSRRLHDLGSRLQEYTERSQLRSLTVPGRCEAIHQEHLTIVAALERGDAEAAEDAVRRHVEHARDAYVRSLDIWGA